MALGTAPRLVNGKWVTRTGRTLSAKGQTYWSNLHAQGRTDGQGHIQRFAKAEQATAPPKKPSFDTLLAASKGDQQARAQVRIYSQSKRARQQAKADVQAATDRQFASAIPLAARANKTVNPVAGAVIKSLSPSTALKQAGSELRHGKVLQAGLSAASVIPAGRGLTAVRDAKVAAVAAKAARAEAIGRAGLTDERALVAGQKAQQITEARSRVTRVAIEKPADIVSKAIPKVPLVGERARVMKAAGRETRKEQHRAISDVASEARALPKKGSDEDAAHFWFAHLPPELHNAKGLETVKAGLQRELDRTLRREPIPLEKKASKNVAAKQARVARLQTAYDRAVA
ncbi:MAG TPA: hypothetical protein VNG33_18980, partial [Polyangiaceae bacterium]|nr:hypothetical protein [Polyangiaceae bacterium]